MSERSAPTVGSPIYRVHYAYIVVTLGLFSMLGAQGFTRFGYSMLLPAVRDALGMNFSQMGLLMTAYSVTYAVASPLVGWLVVRLGFRLTLGAGTLVLGVALFATGVAPTYELAFGLQFLAGLGAALTAGPAMSMTAAWFVARRRGMAAGIVSAGAPLGSVVTGPLMPFFVVLFGGVGWRYCWFALGAAVFVFGLFDLALLRDHPSEKGLAPVGGSDNGELSQRRGSVNWKLIYGSPLVWQLCFIAVTSALGATSFNTFFTAYLVKERALSTATAGQLWALTGLVGIASGFIWGSISDRLGRKLGLVATFLMQVACFGLFAIGGSVLIFGFCAFLYGLTARAAFTVTAAFFADFLEERMAAAALGLNLLFAGAGQALGAPIAGAIADSTSSFVLAFWFSAAIALLGALGSFTLPRRSSVGKGADRMNKGSQRDGCQPCVKTGRGSISATLVIRERTEGGAQLPLEDSTRLKEHDDVP